MVRRLALVASFLDYSMMDLTYCQHLHVKHQQNTGLFQLILTIDHTWFSDLHQSALFEPKQVSYCILVLR